MPVLVAPPLASPMQGRTLAKISDFSLSEQLFLYDRARQLKSSVVGYQTEQGNKIEKSTIDSMRLEDARRKTAYLIFMENSTRTKESFRNAALFHDVKVNDFDCATSSFAKVKEGINLFCWALFWWWRACSSSPGTSWSGLM